MGLALWPEIRDDYSVRHVGFVLGAHGGGLRSAHSFWVRLLGAGCGLLLVCSTASAQTSKSSTATKKSSIASKTTRKGRKSKKTAGWRKRGQKKIDPERARAIQEALIREHYLDGKATGVWDQASQNAMERYQADNGWQSKSIPDSRALIKLGLGPGHEHLLNPESAMTNGSTRESKDASGSNPPQR
jgi:hypothetical protein